MKRGNKGFALVFTGSPEDPTVSFSFNMVFSHDFILSAYEDEYAVVKFLQGTCRTLEEVVRIGI